MDLESENPVAEKNPVAKMENTPVTERGTSL